MVAAVGNMLSFVRWPRTLRLRVFMWRPGIRGWRGLRRCMRSLLRIHRTWSGWLATWVLISSLLGLRRRLSLALRMPCGTLPLRCSGLVLGRRGLRGLRRLPRVL